MNIKELQELNQLAQQEGKGYRHQRWLYSSLRNDTGRSFLGIIGSRGSGKTVLLKQIAAEEESSFYISLDTLLTGPTDYNLPEVNLFQLVKELSSQYGVKLFLIDEVHHCTDVHAELKKIYDFLKVRIIFTSSVALKMQETSHDLSRRVRLLSLSMLSFREYLLFTQEQQLSVLTLKEVIEGALPAKYMQFEYLFEDYLREKLLSFALEEKEALPLLNNILSKVIEKDIPSVRDLKTSELGTIKKLVEFIGKSPVEGINPSSLSSNLGMTKYKASQYLDLLEQSFIVKQIEARGTNVLKEPKVLMTPPYRLLYSEYEAAKGGLREDYVAEMLKSIGHSFYYLKNKEGEKCPDFLLEGFSERVIIEVGGAGKGTNQFKGLKGSFKKIVLQPDSGNIGPSRPLSALGFLY
ncbi:AAA family ATPase [Oligoflexia bacterium]|nr:AAA family ATPase [Oligoflexia bacterium]